MHDTANLPALVEQAINIWGRLDVLINNASSFYSTPIGTVTETHWDDLIGLSVVTLDGLPLGTVDHLIETGANDVLVVRGERERLIPFIQGSVIAMIDLDARVMQVDWDPDF